MRRITLLCVALLFSLFANATHIVGGSLTYEHIGGATYRVTLKMYRDCRPGNAAFAGSVQVQVRDQNGNGFTPSKDFTMNFSTSTSVNPYVDTCAVNPGLCLEEAIYTRVVNIFPPNPGGYFLFVRYCCRNSTLNNINNPLSTGDNWNTHIPDMGSLITDTSPLWVNPPPVFVCQAEPINFDFSATDADGDSLVYSWAPALDSMTPTIVAGNATYTPVSYQAGFGPNNPCGGPNLTINPQTGFITGAPPNIGQFVGCVRCEEYRNGVKIGYIERDFQFNVIYCPPLAQAMLGTPAGVCSGSNVQFVNNSDPANSYFWDFGDGTTLADTSNQVSPNYTYPGLGPYTVMLVINVGTACADTAVQQVQLSYVTTAMSPSNDSACVGQPIAFTDNSVPSPNSTISSYWWDFGDATTSTQQNPSHAYGSSGTYTVTHAATNDLGCDDTITQTVYIIPPPIALAGNDTFACTNNATFGLGGNVLNSTGGGYWSGPGTFTPDSTVLNATYTPTAAEISQGFTYLILSTTGASLCSQDADSVRIDFTPGPTMDIGPDIIVCRDTPMVAVCATFTLATGCSWSTSGCGSFANPTAACTNYTPCPADRASGQVYLFCTTTGNGSCLAETDTLTLFMTPPPNVSASGPDTACSNLPFTVTASTATGQGYWSTSGDGTFPGGSNGLSVNYLPGTGDLANGSVQIIFNSLNNGGCQQQHDTLFVTILPAPNALFTWVSGCPGTTIPFTDISTSVTPIVAWSWNFGDPPLNNTSALQNPSHIYQTGGYYNVTLVVTSVNGCPDSVVLQPQVYPDPVSDFITSGYCLNDGTQFAENSSISFGSIVNYEWNFGDNTTATGDSVFHQYASASTWNVTLITTSNLGCKDTITKPVIVYPSPTAAFTFSPPNANIQQQVHFTDQSYTNVVAWWWTFGDSTGIVTQQNPNHSWIYSGTYPVTLIVADTNGCTDTTVQDYIISAPPVVPNAFSPNGDGQNDYFWVRGGPFTDLELRIYNNWGELIYVGTEQRPGWDGTRDGIPQPIGVYVYTVYAKTPDAKEHHLSGDVTLLR
jgi:gliding motility-associated-like protein